MLSFYFTRIIEHFVNLHDENSSLDKEYHLHIYPNILKWRLIRIYWMKLYPSYSIPLVHSNTITSWRIDVYVSLSTSYFLWYCITGIIYRHLIFALPMNNILQINILLSFGLIWVLGMCEFKVHVVQIPSNRAVKRNFGRSKLKLYTEIWMCFIHFQD